MGFNLLKNFSWHRPADRNGPRKLLVMDLAGDGTRVVSMTRDAHAMTWSRGWSLPKVGDDLAATRDDVLADLRRLADESPYLSVVVGGHQGLVRLLNFPGQPVRKEALAQQVRQTLGVDESYSVMHRVVRRQEAEGANGEYSVLACALPTEQVNVLGAMISEAGMIPVSLILQGVAAANLAEADPESFADQVAVGFFHVSESSSMLLLYDGEDLSLARGFKVGIGAVVEGLMAEFDLDYPTALKLLNSGSFDFSGNMSAPVNSWLHQVSISLDFIERRYGRRVDVLHVLGPGHGTQVLQAMLTQVLKRRIEPWRFLPALGTDEVPDHLDAPPEQFALALCEATRIMQRGLDNEA